MATAAALLSAPAASVAAPRTAVPTPPPPAPKVTQNQVDAAANDKTALANLVGQLGGQIAQAQTQLLQLRGRQEQAEQLVAYRVSLLAQSKDAAVAATKRVGAAQHSVDAAHVRFVQYLQATYMTGDIKGTTGSLLTADDPSALLDRGTLEQYQAQSQVDAIGSLQAATVAKSNADAVARRAVRSQAQATVAAQAAKQAADDAVAGEQAQQEILQSAMDAKQHELETAKSRLIQLSGQRAAYLQYQQYLVEQARARALAAAQEKIRQAALARMAAEKAAAAAAARAEAKAAAAALKARRAHRPSPTGSDTGGGGSGGSSSGGNGGGGDGGAVTVVSVPRPSGPSAPTGGGWTAAKGQRAVSRAMSQLGVPYAWAGGGTYGPGRGVCDASNGAPNDCYVIGFDCSGLMLYAWGADWAHLAMLQYSEAGHDHPSTDNLMPGDLLFWSYNGSVSGIHHVAMYIGGGQIIQAPESNDVVRITSMYSPGDIFGATRPFT